MLGWEVGHKFFNNIINFFPRISPDRPETFTIESKLIGNIYIFPSVFLHRCFEMLQVHRSPVDFRVYNANPYENIILINSLKTFINSQKSMKSCATESFYQYNCRLCLRVEFYGGRTLMLIIGW